MKILQIVGEIDSGGVAAVVYNYLSHMDLSEFEIDILAFEIPEKKEQLLQRKFEDLGCHVIYFRHRNMGYAEHFKKYKKLLKIRKYDIVHCHFGIWSTPYLVVAWTEKVKIRIAHSHVAIDEYSGLKRLILNLSKPMLNAVTTDRFACGKEAAKCLWGKTEGVVILQNAVDLKKFKFNIDTRKEVRLQLGILDDVLAVGHVGRFCYQKNQEFIIAIAKAMKKKRDNFVIFLVGDGEDFSKIQDLIEINGLQDNVRTLGVRNDVDLLMQAFDVFILPSRFEGLPVVVVEAKASGLPTILADTITNEIDYFDNNIYLSLDSVENWAETIFRMGMKSKRDEAIRHSVSFDFERAGFDISRESAKLFEFYRSKVRQV